MLNKNSINELDLSSPAFIANPYPSYQILREMEAPYRLPFYGDSENGMWLFSRYDDVNAVLQEVRRTSTNVKTHLSNTVSTPFAQTMMQLDPPDHTRHQKILSKYFMQKNLQPMESRIEKIVDDCLDKNGTGTGMEFMEDFAFQVPTIIIAELLGIPVKDVPLLHKWSLQIANGADYISSSLDQRQQQFQAMQNMQAYFTEWLAETHNHPENTITYDLLEIYKSSDLLSKAELLSMLVLLLMAGHGNVSSTLGNGLLTLLKHTEQKELLTKNPQLIDSAVEEILRYESPLQRPIIRIVTEEMKVGKFTFPPGENLSTLLGSANRDPAQFAHADVFDITRKPNRHLAFGSGIHACLGASLSRMQLRITFLRLFEKRPNIHLASEPLQWRPLTMLRALQSLPVLF